MLGCRVTYGSRRWARSGRRSGFFSLGAVLYEMPTATTPDGDSPSAIASRVNEHRWRHRRCVHSSCRVNQPAGAHAEQNPEVRPDACAGQRTHGASASRTPSHPAPAATPRDARILSIVVMA
jgi:hypothetical protein